MPNGHLDIGNGIGDAVAWNSAPAVQAFSNVLAQQKAEKDAQDKALINQMASISPTGIREGDKSDYQNKYNDWKQTAINANAMPKNAQGRLDALAQAQRKFNDINNFIGESKKEAANEHAMGNMILNNRHIVSDSAQTALQKSMGVAMSHKDFIPGNKYSTLERYVDPTKMDADYDKFKKGITDNAQWDNGVDTPGKRGNETGVYTVQTRGIPASGEEGALHKFLNKVTLDKDWQKHLADQYPTLKGATDAETNALRATQYMSDKGDKEGFYDQTKPSFNANRQDQRFSALQLWNMKNYGNPNGPNAANANALTPTQGYGKAMMGGDIKAGQEFVNLIPKTHFKPNETPKFDIVNGQHTITIPEQVEPNNKVIEANQVLRNKYAKNPETDGILGIGGKPIPFEQSQMAKKLNPNEYNHKADAQTYTLPDNPVGYQATLGEIAAKNGISASAINQMAGGKGGHGLSSVITEAQKKQPTKGTSGLKWK